MKTANEGVVVFFGTEDERLAFKLPTNDTQQRLFRWITPDGLIYESLGQTWYENVGFPFGLLTSDNKGIRRLAVDSQQTSFEGNTQFRLFYEIDNVATTDQIVFKFSSVNGVNIIRRSLELYTGGLKYRVYPDTENVTFTGTLSPVDTVTWVNGNLSDSGLPSLPATGVTIESDIGSSIFSTTDWPRNGTVVVTDGNAQRATNNYAPNDEKGGVAPNQSFWLVLDHVGSNNTANGFLTIMWEELF